MAMATRRPSPSSLLVLGLVCAVAAAACFAISTTLRDETRLDAEGHELAKSEPIRTEFAYQISDAIAPRATAPSPIDLNRANDIADRAVDSEAFQEAFALAWPNIYGQLAQGASGDVVLDPALVDQAIRASGGVPPEGLQLRVDRGNVPDLRRPLELVGKLAGALAAIAVLLVSIALALTERRNRALMRIGRWMITTGIVTIVVFWALPTLALLPLGGWVGVIGVVLSTGDWLVVPAAVMAALGVTIVVIGRAAEAESRRRDLSVIPTSIGRTPHHPTIG